MQVVVRAPAFQRLATTIGNSKYCTDAYKNDPVVAMMMSQPASRRFPVQDCDLLATTMMNLIRSYDVPELFSYIHLLSTLGRVATAFLSASSRDESVLEIQELNSLCRNWHARLSDDCSIRATMVDGGSSRTSQYVVFCLK